MFITGPMVIVAVLLAAPAVSECPVLTVSEAICNSDKYDAKKVMLVGIFDGMSGEGYYLVQPSSICLSKPTCVIALHYQPEQAEFECEHSEDLDSKLAILAENEREGEDRPHAVVVGVLRNRLSEEERAKFGSRTPSYFTDRKSRRSFLCQKGRSMWGRSMWEAIGSRVVVCDAKSYCPGPVRTRSRKWLRKTA